MRFIPFELAIKKDTFQYDSLGNPILNKEYLSTLFYGRLTEWTAEDVAVNGRDLTVGTRKLLCNAITKEQSKNAVSVKINGTEYTVKSVKDLGRWQMLIVQGFRV